jgi:PAS domain S-box-containing protein
MGIIQHIDNADIQYLQSVSEALNQSALVCVLNAEGRIIKVNELFCQASKYNQNTLLGKSLAFLASKHHPAIFLKYLWKTISSGHIWKGNLQCNTADNHFFWLELSINPILNDHHEIVEYLLIAQDITLRKKIAKERKKLIEELSHRNKDLEDFAHITSHNLRAPIASILGLLSIYDKNDPLAVINPTVIDSLQKAAENMDSIFNDVNQILAMRDLIDELYELIDLETVFQHIQSSLHKQIQKAKAVIHCNFKNVAQIYSIRNYIESILTNLISNAIKYRSEHTPPIIHVESSIYKQWICLSVSDNGLGLDLTKYKNKLFGLYQRFHFHTGGKGIGLHLVKTQVDALGGKIEVQSEVNRGSSFKIYIEQKNEV